jgi:hypothetical protein
LLESGKDWAGLFTPSLAFIPSIPQLLMQKHRDLPDSQTKTRSLILDEKKSTVGDFCLTSLIFNFFDFYL